MTNLSDLLPAGAGAKSATFTADGTLSSGQTVALQSNGTVKAVTETTLSDSTGSGNSVVANGETSSIGCWHEAEGVYVSFFYDQADSYLKARAGTVSGTTISFGTAATTPGPISSSPISAVYYPPEEKIIVAHEGYSILSLSVSGTTVTWDSNNTSYDTNGTANRGGFLTYDPTYQVAVICFRNVYGRVNCRTVQLSGTTFTFGTQVQPYGTNDSAQNSVQAVYNSGVKRHFCTFNTTTTQQYTILEVTAATGSNLSFTSPSTLDSGGPYDDEALSLAYDPDEDFVVINYRDNNNSYYGTVRGRRISTSTITASTNATVYASYQANHQGAAYNTAAGKVFIGWQHDTDLDVIGVSIETLPSSGAVTFGTQFNIGDSSAIRERNSAAGHFIIYDPDDKRIIAQWQEYVSSPYQINAYVITQSYTETNSANFVGITDEAIANSATGSVVVEGGQITNTGLLPPTFSTPFGTPVVYEAASVAISGITFDSSNNKIVIAYRDGGNSNYGTAIVGTVSGTSISYGTPVVFATADTEVINCTFDTSNNKVVIAFKDSGNSSYGTAIVGTVSGTSISFGTEVVFNSANTAYMGITFDSNANKAVIAYSNVGASPYAGTGIVGTVSGTSISFGSASTFGTADSSGGYDVTFPKIAFDSTANKVVIIFRGLNGYTRGVVGTVSGTSISFGTDQTVDTNTGPVSQNVVYDSNADRSVFIFVASDGTGKAYAASLSGTTLTFGDQLTWESSATAAEVGACYDSNANRTILTYRDGSNSNAGTSIPLAVSGLTVTAETQTVFTTNRADATVAAFDSNLNKVVVSYTDAGNSSYGTAAVGTPASAAVDLSVGSTYYVQDDGSLSTTSSSVTAGKAIATNKLLLKG